MIEGKAETIEPQPSIVPPSRPKPKKKVGTGPPLAPGEEEMG